MQRPGRPFGHHTSTSGSLSEQPRGDGSPLTVQNGNCCAWPRTSQQPWQYCAFWRAVSSRTTPLPRPATPTPH
eukprot:5908400-Prorocentrum_lima.AAC.1